jgi:hypothetical protein
LNIAKKPSRFLILLMFFGVMLLANGGCGGSGGPSSGFAGGQGTPEDPYQIATAEQLENVRNHLDKSFVLSSDIDLASYENWEPIGAFVPISEKEEDAETPVMELTFSGIFDGGGHKISNVTVNAPDRAGVGLFGCIAGDTVSVSNLTVENANVKGMMLVAGVIGYGSSSEVKNVRLTGNDNHIEGWAMVGGIVGGGFCNIIGCEAQANVKLVGDSGQVAGILAGGMETCDITDSHAKGTVTVEGTNNAGIGGLAGCAMESQNVLNCTSDVVITVGEGNMMIGGLLGYAGRSADYEPTLIFNCSATAVINAPDSAERIGGIVGGGFYMPAYKDYFPEPVAIKITNCDTSGQINGGTIVGTIIGYAYNNSSVEGGKTDMTVNGSSAGQAKQIGATDKEVALSDLH